jgi:hypothetical protein
VPYGGTGRRVPATREGRANDRLPSRVSGDLEYIRRSVDGLLTIVTAFGRHASFNRSGRK